MISFENQQDCAKRYAASSNIFQTIMRLIGWLGILAAVLSFFLGFFDVIESGLGIVLAVALVAASGFVILIGKVIKSQSQAILAILETVTEQQAEQD